MKLIYFEKMQFLGCSIGLNMLLFTGTAAIQHASDRVISGASNKYTVGSDGP
jgi:hypothetical protein